MTIPVYACIHLRCMWQTLDRVLESSPGVASYLQLMKAPQDMTKAARAVRAATILVFIEI